MKQLSTGQIQAVLDVVEGRTARPGPLSTALTKLREGLDRGRERDRRRSTSRHVTTCALHPDEPTPCVQCNSLQEGAQR